MQECGGGGEAGTRKETPGTLPESAGDVGKAGNAGNAPPAGVRRRDVGRSERHGDKRQDNKTTIRQYDKTTHVTNIENH